MSLLKGKESVLRFDLYVTIDKYEFIEKVKEKVGENFSRNYCGVKIICRNQQLSFVSEKEDEILEILIAEDKWETSPERIYAEVKGTSAYDVVETYELLSDNFGSPTTPGNTGDF